VIDELQQKLGVTFFDYQLEAFEKAQAMPGPAPKRCLYYKTGAGKSITSLVDMVLWDQSEVLVITPPSTYSQWVAAGARLGIDVECMSHAKFRMKDTRLSRNKAIIADEMHLFGGHGGQGWKKLDRMAAGMQAPLILASATPNYNDADRVYCIQHILDPYSCRGGFLQFLYAECTTEQNPFGMEPIVTGFQRYPDAAAYLADLPGVDYLPDDLVYTIEDRVLWTQPTPDLDRYGINHRSRRVIASIIEERHARINLALIGDSGSLRAEAYDAIVDIVRKEIPVLVFAAHSTVADALGHKLAEIGLSHAVVTGATPTKQKAEIIARFNRGGIDVLVGTASLATGTDGMDKVCDTLIILDDTDDDSLRRQLIGRIMPRGADADASAKQVYRLVLQ